MDRSAGVSGLVFYSMRCSRCKKITKFLGLPKIAFQEYNIDKTALYGRTSLKGIVLMELIVISESKLKIMLTAPDMAYYELESARMDCADAHTRAAFRHIFDDARAEIGFDTEGERLFVQLYASREGGCEIFVTKLGNWEDSFPAVGEALWDGPLTDCDEAVGHTLAVAAESMSEGERKLLRRVCDYCDICQECDVREEGDGMAQDHYDGIERVERRTVGVGVRRAALVFTEMGDLLTVCRRLLRDGYRGRSDIYIAESAGRTDWYMILDVPDVTVYRLPRRFAFLTEYGREVTGAGLTAYLTEYGRSICSGNGVDLLGRL